MPNGVAALKAGVAHYIAAARNAHKRIIDIDCARAVVGRFNIKDQLAAVAGVERDRALGPGAAGRALGVGDVSAPRIVPHVELHRASALDP